MEYLVILTLVGWLSYLIYCWFSMALKLDQALAEKADQIEIEYTTEMIKDICIQYWRLQLDRAPTTKEKGACLVKATKTDKLLDEILAPPVVPSEPEVNTMPTTAETIEQLISRADNIIPLWPKK